MDISSLVTTSAILTAVVAFAMQDTLGNVLSGLAIQLDNSLQVGDWVQLEKVSGRVTDIRWRSTLIETRDWETVVVPNTVRAGAGIAVGGAIGMILVSILLFVAAAFIGLDGWRAFQRYRHPEPTPTPAPVQPAT